MQHLDNCTDRHKRHPCQVVIVNYVVVGAIVFAVDGVAVAVVLAVGVGDVGVCVCVVFGVGVCVGVFAVGDVGVGDVGVGVGGLVFVLGFFSMSLLLNSLSLALFQVLLV